MMDNNNDMPYSLKLRFASENAFAKKFISITAVVRINDSNPAPINQKFCVLRLNIDSFRERILNAWNISAMERVKNAIEVPIVSGKYMPT